jgi:hypothetical protein
MPFQAVSFQQVSPGSAGGRCLPPVPWIASGLAVETLFAGFEPGQVFNVINNTFSAI